MLNIEFSDKEPDINDNNNFCFVSDKGWNDYGYKTLFQLYYKNSNKWVYINFVRLVISNSDNITDHCTEIVKLKNLKNLVDNGQKVWMIGENSKFYFELKNIINDKKIMSDFLNSMNDLTKKPSELNELKKQENKEDQEKKDGIIERSLFRDYTDSRLIYNTYKIIRENLKDDWNVLTNRELINWLNCGSLNKLLEEPFLLSDKGDSYQLLSSITSLLISKNCNEKSSYSLYNLDNSFNEGNPFETGENILKVIYDLVQKKAITTSLENFTENEIQFLKKLRKLFYNFPEFQILIKLVNIVLDKKPNQKIIQILSKVRKLLDIKDDVLKKNKKLRLGQYSNAETIQYLIKPISKKDVPSLRLSHGNQMNDPLEGRLLINYLINKEILKPEDENEKIFVSSATSYLDSLAMWRDYGDQGKGVVLVYSDKYINKLFCTEYVSIFRVCYLSQDNEVKVAKISKKENTEEIEKKLQVCLSELKGYDMGQVSSALEQFKELWYVFKSMDYSYENEFRILLNLNNVDLKISSEYFDKKNDKLRFPLPLVYAIIKDVNNNSPQNLRSNYSNFPDLRVDYQEVKYGPLSTDKDYLTPYIRFCEPDPKKLRITNSDIKFRG